MNTVKNWIVKNVHPIDYDRFLFWGSTTLYAYGVRKCRDVDGLVGGTPSSKDSKTPFLEERLKKSFFEKESKFFFADMGMPGTSLWEDRWDKKDEPYFKLVGVKYRDELIFDPNQYFYYNGLKIASLVNNIKKRILRRKISDIGDLLEIERKTNIDIDFPSISDYSKEYFVKLLKEYMGRKYKDNDTYLERIELFKFKTQN